jgi:hypothetical protein
VITVDALIGDRNLLGPYFEGASWARWRAVLKGAYALRMTRSERDLFRAVTDREPPARRVREIVAIIGRRGGKDSVASAIATHAAIGDYSAALRPGELATVLCLAVDRAQARIVLGYIKGYFEAVPMLRELVARETVDGLELTNRVEIIVGTNDFRSVRGKAIVCAVLDEAAFYGGDGASPDREVVAAITPALATLANSILVIITSPHRKSGLVYDLWARHYGKADDDVLVIRGASRQFNPTLDQRMIDEAIERDPQAGAAEWLAEFRSDLASFIDRDLVERAVEPGRTVLPPIDRAKYHAFADPSGGAGDAFTMGIAHAEGEAIILDCLIERRPPFNPSVVVEEMAASVRPYRVGTVTGDRYAAQWVVEAFAKHGIRYRHSHRDRSALYFDALPLFTSGRAQLLDNRRLVAQFAGLERRTSSGGRDRIDHGPNGHDDLCNAAAGAMVLASQGGTMKFLPPLIVTRAEAMAPGTVSAFAAEGDPFAAIGGRTPRW